MQQSPGAVLGRELELERLEAALDGPGAGIFEIVGEPGIGKTRLLAELSALAQDRRSLVFYGRAAEFESEIPFVLLVDALDPYLASQNPRRFGVLSAEERAELGALFPAFGELGGSVVQAVQNERDRAHRAVRALVELRGSERPCVLALDDVHSADQASLEH